MFLQESDESALESKELENESALGDDETGQECSCKRATRALLNQKSKRIRALLEMMRLVKSVLARERSSP